MIPWENSGRGLHGGRGSLAPLTILYYTQSVAAPSLENAKRRIGVEGRGGEGEGRVWQARAKRGSEAAREEGRAKPVCIRLAKYITTVDPHLPPSIVR